MPSCIALRHNTVADPGWSCGRKSTWTLLVMTGMQINLYLVKVFDLLNLIFKWRHKHLINNSYFIGCTSDYLYNSGGKIHHLITWVKFCSFSAKVNLSITCPGFYAWKRQASRLYTFFPVLYQSQYDICVVYQISKAKQEKKSDLFISSYCKFLSFHL